MRKGYISNLRFASNSTLRYGGRAMRITQIYFHPVEMYDDWTGILFGADSADNTSQSAS